MRCPSHVIRRRRRGAHLVECALVCPVVLLMSIGTVVVGLGVFRYQETASLAREAARWASVRGWQYQHDLNPYGLSSLPMAATAQDIRAYVASQSVLLDTSSNTLKVDVSWNTDNRQSHTLMDSYGTPQLDSSGNVIVVGNVITVTVTYNWTPELLFVGPIALSSKSSIPMSY